MSCTMIGINSSCAAKVKCWFAQLNSAHGGEYGGLVPKPPACSLPGVLVHLSPVQKDPPSRGKGSGLTQQ